MIIRSNSVEGQASRTGERCLLLLLLLLLENEKMKRRISVRTEREANIACLILTGT